MESDRGISAVESISHHTEQERREEDGQCPEQRMGQEMTRHKEDGGRNIRYGHACAQFSSPSRSAQGALNDPTKQQLFDERLPQGHGKKEERREPRP